MAFIPPTKPGEEFKSPSRGERLQRFMADQGIASRRACEDLIREGRVSVNGIRVQTLPIFVDTEHDHVEIDGRGLGKPEGKGRPRHEYVLLYKPARTICAVKDEPGLERTTVMDLVRHHSGKRLFPVGRLDYDTTGLLLLTDDGELTNRLTHPKFNIPKVYEIVVKGSLSIGELENLRKDLRKFEKQATRRENGKAPTEVVPVDIELIAKDADKTLLRVTIRESRNREIRQMIAAAGLTIRKVERVGLGPLELTGVRMGSWRDLEPAEVKALYKASEHGMPQKTPQQIAKAGRPIGSFKLGSRGRDSRPLTEPETYQDPRAKVRAGPRKSDTPVSKVPVSAPIAAPKPKLQEPVFDVAKKKGPRVIGPRQY